MTKWSEAQKQRAHEYKMLRRKQEHEKQMHVLSVMAKDPEMKYFLGVCFSGAAGALGAVLEEAFAGTPSEGTIGYQEAAETGVSETLKSVWGWVVPPGLSDWVNPFDSDASASVGMFGFVPGLLKLGGTGFAGFCATVLILKAIFGDEDVASLMTGTGTVADAAMPL